MRLHLKYIIKVLNFNETKFTKQLAQKGIARVISWLKEVRDTCEKVGVSIQEFSATFFARQNILVNRIVSATVEIEVNSFQARLQAFTRFIGSSSLR